PAAKDGRLDGTHGGKNAGRACWVVTGTFCTGEMEGTFAQKFKSCAMCDFYKTVRRDEFPEFQLAAVILRNIEKEEVVTASQSIDSSSRTSSGISTAGKGNLEADSNEEK
ncbi:MAG TPA: hypothetical protein VN328_11550, partial [Thermodesulfovibrionales bacterium]|nr:hypothetical protein [Thermodesulfovibrionales bacterium]